jgi:dTDP-4-dehydrorhamnose reductase
MKTLILGANGMLGSMTERVLSKKMEMTVLSTSSNGNGASFSFNVLTDSIDDLVSEVKPDYIVNAIGVIKPRIDEKDTHSVFEAVSINSAFPHLLNKVAEKYNAFVIQIATDCVYSGKEGNYNENSLHDPLDVYGKSKSLGEVNSENFLNIRASIIGPEVGRSQSLLEWFKGQDESLRLKGFSNHMWNGVTTLQFAKVCASLISEEAKIYGIFHFVPANMISKYDLLQSLNREYCGGTRDIESVIVNPAVDRTLSTIFHETNKTLWSLAGYQNIPTVGEMVKELAQFSSE